MQGPVPDGQREVLSYDHGISHEPLIGSTIGAHFHRVARQQADREAVVSCHQGVRLTYRELEERVDLFANGLTTLGVERGDRVGIWSTNNVEWIITQLATAKIGAILVNINPAYRTAELEYALRQSGVKVLILIAGFKGDEYLAMLHEVAPHLLHEDMKDPSPRLPELKRIILIGQRRTAHGSVLPFESVLTAGEALDLKDLELRATQLQFDDPINLQYTSGTTGFPKGVTLSHHNLLNNAFYAGHAMGVGPGSRFCVPMPFYHCGGMVLCTLATLIRGGTLVIPSPSFDAERVLTSVEQERCTHLSGVPTMYIAELGHADFNRFDLRSLCGGFMAGAPCPVKLMREVAERMHLSQIVIFYGLTECSPVITSTTTADSLEKRATTVGRVIPHLEVKIVDPVHGGVVPRGAQGEICARGYAVMLGYWNDPDATRDAVDAAGWLHTGDLGVMHEQGWLNITGRKKDMIIRGGENIYPREIEEILHNHPGVMQAQAFGVPDSHYGEEVALWVQLQDGADCDEEGLRLWLKERVAHFKVPRYIKLVSAFPMTVTGKIQKYVMRQQMIEELGLEAAGKVETA